MQAEVLVEVTRGPLVENRHRGHVAVVDWQGKLLWSAGTHHRTYWRSSAKPVQACRGGAGQRIITALPGRTCPFLRFPQWRALPYPGGAGYLCQDRSGLSPAPMGMHTIRPTKALLIRRSPQCCIQLLGEAFRHAYSGHAFKL